jgi:tagatose-6-phosphate ketose/aldose isomerase
VTTRNNYAAATGASATSREIQQQPHLWSVVADEAAARADEMAAFLAPILEDPQARIVLSGAGTSAFAGDVLAPSLRRRLRRRIDAVATTDIVAGPHEVFAEDVPTVLVSLARSGDSPESQAATVIADDLLTSVRHLVVTCNEDGRLATVHGGRPDSTVLLMPPAANDHGFAMTSSFTCMLLATQLAFDPGNLGRETIAELGAAADRLLAERGDDIGELAARRYQRVVYLGSGAMTGLAREGALKLLELTAGQIVSYWDSSLGFRHGPKAVLSEGTLAVVFVSPDPYTRRYDDDIATELRQALGSEHVVEVTSHSDATRDASAWRVGDFENVPDVFVALPYAVLAQQFAMLCSLELGHTPDNPFPSGELNRVVRGVQIYPVPEQT